MLGNLWLRLHLTCFAATCRGCGGWLDPVGTAHDGFPFLCAPCTADLPWRAHPEHNPSQPSAAPGALRRIWAAWHYEQPLVRWIWSLKYHGQDALAVPLGRLLARQAWAAGPLEDVDAVVPVPLHRRRLRSRGFNQALLVAHQWLAGLSPAGGEDRRAAMRLLQPRWLVRSRFTRPQMTLSAAERHLNVQGAFTVPQPRGWLARQAPEWEGKRVLLVDDVMTTGATLTECAAALRGAGAAAVDALVLAKIDDPRLDQPLQPEPLLL